MKSFFCFVLFINIYYFEIVTCGVSQFEIVLELVDLNSQQFILFSQLFDHLDGIVGLVVVNMMMMMSLFVIDDIKRRRAVRPAVGLFDHHIR